MKKQLNENLKVFENGFGDSDYWLIADVIKGIYTSDGSMAVILDFERVLDELDIYSYRNWRYGELVEGPDIGRYSVTCVFLWPYKLMPDPRAALRLTSLDCTVEYKQEKMKIPEKITNPGDFRPGTHKARLIEKDVWLIRITMPKDLMQDIKTGSLELEDQSVDLADLEDAYEEDLDKKQNMQNNGQQQTQTQQVPTPGMLGAPAGQGTGVGAMPGAPGL